MRRTMLPKGEHTQVIPLQSLVEILGDHRVLIERHKGVLGYDRHEVCVKLPFGRVAVNGCNLEIVHMSKSQLVISGKICDITFKRSTN